MSLYWMVCYVGIGSNLGKRKENIKEAIACLKETAGIKVDKVSHIYETNPVGGPRQKRFLNGVIRLRTSLAPLELLSALKKIEKNLGRKKTVRLGARIIDLDILIYGSKIIKQKSLKVPHPKMFERDFVLRPLLEIV